MIISTAITSLLIIIYAVILATCIQRWSEGNDKYLVPMFLLGFPLVYTLVYKAMAGSL